MTESGPRVLACCGGMVIVSGLERMTFETLRVLSERVAAVHCCPSRTELRESFGVVLVEAKKAGAAAQASLDRFSRARFASGWWDLIRGGA